MGLCAQPVNAVEVGRKIGTRRVGSGSRCSTGNGEVHVKSPARVGARQGELAPTCACQLCSTGIRASLCPPR